VGELRTAKDVAHGVDPRRRGGVAIVGDDVAARVEAHARGLAGEIVGVGAATERDEEVRAAHLALVELHDQLAPALRHRARLAAEAQRDALGDEHRFQRRRGVGILARQKVRVAIDDGDAGAEAAEHLPHLAADVAAAEDDEVRRQRVERLVGAVVVPAPAVEAGERRARGAHAGVDDDELAAVTLAGDLDLPLADEARRRAHQHQPLAGRRDASLDSGAPAGDDGVLARHHRREVDAHVGGVDAEARGGAGDMGGARARHHRLGGRAAAVDAGAAEIAALGQEHALTSGGQAGGQGNARLPAANHDDVEVHGPLHRRG
jgi:hypothetical protein